jgi:hypothetical protein
MRAAAAGLVANLRAGTRLALFLRVSRHDFRIDASALVLLVVASALVDLGVERAGVDADALLNLGAVSGELTGLAILVLGAAILASVLRDVALVLALPVVILASMFAVQLAALLPGLLDALAELPERAYIVIDMALFAWFAGVLVRGTYVALQPQRRRAMHAWVGAGLLAAPLFLPGDIVPFTQWWTGGDEVAVPEGTHAASEPVLALQRELQDEALADLEDHVPGQTDLYFVGFAPDGAGALWKSRLGAAREAVEARYGEGRSVVYVNDAAALSEAPFATVTHLREALDEIAAASDPEEDVAMLYVAGRSHADGTLRAELAPLGLVPLSGAGLAHLFREAGIRWRIVVLEVCDAGPFLDALADDDTLVVSAAGPDDTPAACRRGEEPTAFGEAFFGAGLPGARSLAGAFESARRSLEGRDATPVMHVGRSITPMLERLGGERRERAAFRHRSPR